MLLLSLGITSQSRQLMGRGDLSRSDFGRLKPPLPEKNAPKTSSITFGKLTITGCLTQSAACGSNGDWENWKMEDI